MRLQRQEKHLILYMLNQLSHKAISYWLDICLHFAACKEAIDNIEDVVSCRQPSRLDQCPISKDLTYLVVHSLLVMMLDKIIVT